jgi:hypothetical protein
VRPAPNTLVRRCAAKVWICERNDGPREFGDSHFTRMCTEYFRESICTYKDLRIDTVSSTMLA